MFGLDSTESGQRMWNLMVYDIYATNKDMEQLFPFLAVALAVLFLGTGIYLLIQRIKEWLG